MLLYTNSYSDTHAIVRTRNEDVMQSLGILCDVGSVYDPETLRFDHHQKTFDTYWKEKDTSITKLSSAGLIYKHYGKEVVINAMKRVWGLEYD